MSDLVPVQQALELGTEEMVRDALEGVKCISIRPSHRDYAEGGVLVLYYRGTMESPDGFAAWADITSVRHCTIGEVTEQEWSDDGFDSLEDLLDELNVYYKGALTLESPATVLRWDNLRGPQVEFYRSL